MRLSFLKKISPQYYLSAALGLVGALYFDITFLHNLISAFLITDPSTSTLILAHFTGTCADVGVVVASVGTACLSTRFITISLACCRATKENPVPAAEPEPMLADSMSTRLQRHILEAYSTRIDINDTETEDQATYLRLHPALLATQSLPSTKPVATGICAAAPTPSEIRSHLGSGKP